MIDHEPIPLMDLVRPHREMEEELLEVVRQALRSARFIGGHQLEGFEEEFARYCEAPHCVGLSNGTDALRLALIAAGVGPGDAVITVPFTFIATVEAILQAGAAVEWVDIDLPTFNLCPVRLEEFLKEQCRRLDDGRLVSLRSGKTVKAVVPVHIYGQPADMGAILDLASSHGLAVVEDAAQAQGARYFSKQHDSWKRAGSMGLAASFSFYPGKNLGACGEAGAITTQNADLARKARMLRDHGQAQKYLHEMEGYNARLDAIQAGFLRIKLRRLEEWNGQRRQLAKHYNQLLQGIDQVVTPFEPSWAQSVHHLYVIRASRRDELARRLAEDQVSTGLHYPLPLHLQKACAHLGWKEGDFPASEQAARQVLSLPFYPGMLPEQQERVAGLVREFAASERGSSRLEALG